MFKMLIVIGWIMSIWFDVIFMFASFVPEKSLMRNLTKNCFVSPALSVFIVSGDIS